MQESMVAQPSLKIWQTWTGRHTFFCDGRLMVGPDYGVSLFAAGLTSCLSLAFWLLVCPQLPGALYFTLGGMTLYLLAIGFLVVTATSDPGILPRAPYVDDAESNANLNTTRTIEVNGVTIALKWCPTCRIWRPPRASHCSECNVCIDRFDHHCPWMGQCIGRRNYRYFFGFVVSVCTLCLYTAAVSAFALERALSKVPSGVRLPVDRLGQAVEDLPAAGVTMLVPGLILLCIAPLLCYHCSLTCRNTTTSEDVKGTFSDSPNPFNSSCTSNCDEALCAARGPSRLHLRSHASEELGGAMILRNDGAGAELQPAEEAVLPLRIAAAEMVLKEPMGDAGDGEGIDVV
mmetsp:Transcript_25468/g.77360  ORF Transcript_25468/g.77360 Transcript_25468/m.77360 type:complete len:346 (-) Transcript_25468:281-1318(-)|eukprot:scaffold89679_cov35-Tisochrysis_lutea.AAC.1